MQRLALVLVLVLLPAALLLGKTSATVYYLDSSFATDGDGTADNPFKNIATAFQVLQQNLSQPTTGVSLVLNILGTSICLRILVANCTQPGWATRSILPPSPLRDFWVRFLFKGRRLVPLRS